MRTTEGLPEEIEKKMLLELYKLLSSYNWLLFTGVVVGGSLFLDALVLIHAGWARIAVGWLGLSLLGASGWVYLRAYRWTKYEIFILEQHLGIRSGKAAWPVSLFYNYIRGIAGSLHFLIFLSGILISLLMVSSLQDKYENSFFTALSGKIVRNSQAFPEDSILIRTQDICHSMLVSRPAIFGDRIEPSLIDKYVHPLSTDLIAANGACGSYSLVLGRLLQTMGYRVRVAQMKSGDAYGCHILLEARSSRGWVVLDPLYNLYFVRPDGGLASFEDVSGNWPYYRLQTPKGYDPRYRYEGVRYTNWHKIPVVLPALKMILSYFMNKERLEHFSLRVYFFRKYLILKYISLFFLLLVSSKIARMIITPGIRRSQRLISFFPIAR